MSDSGEKMNYLYCLDLWFEEHGDYEELKDYIITNNDKAAVGKNIIDFFEKSIKKAKVCNKNFVKEYSVLACQFLTNSKEQPELFVNELLMELNKLMNNEFTNGPADQFYQLNKVERELRTCSQHGQPTDEFLQEKLQAIHNGLEYFLLRIRERALASELKKIAKCLYKSLSHMTRLVRGMQTPIKELFTTLFKNCIYMDLEPSRILKKQTRPNTGTSFKVSLRLLIDDEYIKNTPPVKVKGYYLHQSFLSQFNSESHQPFEIPLVDGEEEFSGDSCLFKKLKVNPGKQRCAQISRVGCRRSEEKGLLVFRAQISPLVLHGEIINVHVLSKPVVLIVHTNQQAEAEGTILWDDHFPIESRAHFETHSEVEIKHFISAVSNFFQNHTGRGLSDENRHHLENMLYSLSNPRTKITFQKVFRDKLPGKTFTFWDWVYAAFRLIKEFLLALWKENIIHGFISYENCLLLFQEKRARSGAWMLRFSESVLGGITISLVDDQHHLLKWEPLTAKHLSGSPLSKQIMEYVDLKCFIDGRSKEEILSPLIDCGELHAGYIPRGMRGILPPILSNITTPSHDGNDDDQDQDMELLGDFFDGGEFPDIDIDNMTE